MYNNPYYNPTPRYQSNNSQMTQSSYMQPIQPMPAMNNQMGLLGKVVDGIEVVKAMDIPLDGSVSYFPLTDGSAIVTKKLLSDGTSKTVIYKPVEDVKPETPAYATVADLEDLKKELNELKDKLKED